jgi:hypothetical protein
MTRRTFWTLCLAAAVWVWGPSLCTAQEVRLNISNGLVTLSARDASLRQIMAEWERVGQTSIPNRERLPATPVTMSLSGVSESNALSTLLRTGYGYLAVTRAQALDNASMYRTILLMAAPPRLATVQTPQGGAASRVDPLGQDRRFAPQGYSMGQGGGRGGGAPPDADQQDDPNQEELGRQTSSPFQMRVVGPNGQIITVPSIDERGRPRGDPSEQPVTGGVASPLMVPTSPGTTVRPGEVVPGPVRRPGAPAAPPTIPTRPPG